MSGRIYKYQSGVADYICDELMAGRSLNDICQEPAMPTRTTVYRWIDANGDFRDKYARARARQCDTLAEEALETARAAGNEDAHAVRVRLDAIKWFTAKVAPRVYGDRQIISGDPENPLAVQAVDRPPAETREQWMARRATELAAASRGLGRPAGSAD